jgi:thymidylate kinase
MQGVEHHIAINDLHSDQASLSAIKYFVIAGPQAAGKSTLVNAISSERPAIITLEESRQIIVHKYQRKGAIFMTRDDEVEVIHHDMTRMFSIIGGDSRDRVEVYLDETNVFTIGHARAHGIDLVAGYYKQYCDMLARLQCAVLFLDVPPDISWSRRRHRYLQRLWDFEPNERNDLMARYEDYLRRLYPELQRIFDHLACPKRRIDATGTPDQVLRAALKTFHELG